MTQHRDIKISEEITSDFVKQTGDERDLAISEFESLRVNSGWQRIVSVLNQKIDGYTKQILDSELQGEELSRVRDRRDLCLWFINSPQILISAISTPTGQPNVPDLDPFDKGK